MIRTRMRQLAALAVVLTASGTFTAACSTGTTTSSDKPVQVVSSLTPSSLDPADALSTQDGIAGSNFYVTLVRYGKTDAAGGFPADDPTKIEPYLASSWTVSDDGKTYDFTLKPGLTFGSGAPVDAEAVVYSFERLLKTPGAYFLNVGIDGLVEKVEATGDYTVRFTLTQAQPTVLAAWASAYAPIVDPTVVPKMPQGWLSSHEAGSGPFELEAYTPGQSLKLVRRPGFEKWAGWTTKSKEVDVSFVGDDSALLLKARSGADVVIGLSNQSADSLRTGTKNVRVVDFQAPITEELLLNWNQKPFDSGAVRKALTLAVPYDDLYEGPGAKTGERYYGPDPAQPAGLQRRARCADRHRRRASQADPNGRRRRNPGRVHLDRRPGQHCRAADGPDHPVAGQGCRFRRHDPCADLCAVLEGHLRRRVPGCPARRVARHCRPGLLPRLRDGVRTARWPEQPRIHQHPPRPTSSSPRLAPP